jgi:hypothetical protein
MTIEKIARAWMLKMVPAAHQEIAGIGGVAAITDLRALGYNYNAARALCLAHQEQHQAQHEPGEK